MPGKKGKKKGKGKGGKGGKGSAKGKKKGENTAENGETKKLFKSYEKNCAQTNSQMCPGIRKLLKLAAEEDKVVTKFIFESVPVEKEGDMPVLFDPLIAALRNERYKHIRDLHIWDYPMSIENVADLALFLERPFYLIRLLELMDCLLDVVTLPRLVRSFDFCDSMITLILDYNTFGDEGCNMLCKGLQRNVTLLSLSLCYCDLEVDSGKYLGQIVSSTAVRELFLDGNELQCEGTMELIKLCVDQAETEAYQREEKARLKAEEEAMLAEQEKGHRFDTTSAGDYSGSEKDSKGKKTPPGSGKKKKKKKKGKKKEKKPEGPPPVGPWIYKLHLADNGIDGFGDGGSFTPIICMRLFKKLLMNSKCLEELDLADNLIGDLGGREIKDGLEYRKEVKLGGIKVRTTHKMTPDTFNSIVKLGSGLKKKGKKGKKGKGKKKKK